MSNTVLITNNNAWRYTSVNAGDQIEFSNCSFQTTNEIIQRIRHLRQLAGLHFKNCQFNRSTFDFTRMGIGSGGLLFENCDLGDATFDFRDLKISGVGTLGISETNRSSASFNFDGLFCESGNLIVHLSNFEKSKFTARQSKLGEGKKHIQFQNVYDQALIDLSETEFNDGDFEFLVEIRSHYKPRIEFKKSIFGRGDRKFRFSPNASFKLDLSECEIDAGSVSIACEAVKNTLIKLRDTSFRNVSMQFSIGSLTESTIDISASKFQGGQIDCSESSFTTSQFLAQGVVAPETSINFEAGKFTDSSADFERSQFGGDKANFSGLQFETTQDNSSQSTLNLTDVGFRGERFSIGGNFNRATLKADGLDVDCTEFSMSSMSMDNAIAFGMTCANISADYIALTKMDVDAENVNFDSAKFEAKRFNCNGARFSAQLIDFANSVISADEILFSDAVWSGSRLTFEESELDAKTLLFDRNEFESAFTNFSKCNFDVEHLEFDNSKFSGRASFSDLRGVSKAKHFSFRHCVFDNSFDLSAMEEFGCVVDLTRTKMTNQFSLENVNCRINKSPGYDTKAFIERWFDWLYVEEQQERLVAKLNAMEWLSKQTVHDKRDVERLRRLKQIAGDNKNHAQSLDYRVKETKAERWNSSTRADLFFEFFFQKLSDYGRSELTVFSWLVLSIGVFACIYANWATKLTMGWALTAKSVTYSLSQTLAFLPVSRTSRDDYATELFGDEALPLAIVWFATAQNLISVLLLFLFGLAIRNRFKI